MYKRQELFSVDFFILMCGREQFFDESRRWMIIEFISLCDIIKMCIRDSSREEAAEHLRQTYKVSEEKIRLCTQVAANEKPVSYTHLDVYKRQIHDRAV